MIVNKQKINLFTWLKRLDNTCTDIAKLLEQEIGNFESKIEQLKSKLFRYEDKILMLEGKLNDKIKAVQNNVAKKFTSYEDEPEKQLKNQNKDISIKISQMEDQLKLKENEIKELESKMKENSKAVDTKICKIEHEISDENEKANEALKIELHDVKNKVNINENKLVAFVDGSRKM